MLYSWTELFILAFLISSYTSSLSSLVILSTMALILGFTMMLKFYNWLFFVMVIIYLGGMMVLFMYLMSLVSKAKIYKLSITMPLGIYLFLSAFAAPRIVSSCHAPLWVSSAFSSSNCSLTILFIIYLLITLVVVFKMCEKTEGPMKSIASM